MATDGQLVLCRNKDGLIAVAAESGEVVRSYPVAFQPVRLALVDGVVVVAGWEKVLGRKMWDAETKPGSALWDLWTPAVDKGAVEAFNVETGERLWEDPVPGQTLLVSDKTVVYLVQGPAPVKQQTVVARDLTTGQERWRMSHESLEGPPNFFLAGVGEGVVVLSRHKPGSLNFWIRCEQVIVLSLRDGEKLWQAEGAGDALVIFAKGELWYGGKRYEPTSGKELGKSHLGVNRGMCVPPVIIGTVAGAPRSDRWTDLEQGKAVYTGGVRGACIQGVAVAEGRMYVAQNWCRCSPGQVPGFLALASETLPSAEVFSAARPVIRGSGKAPSDQEDTCWSTLRGDAARSGASDFAIPTRIEQKWQSTVAKVSDHRVAAVWAQSLQTTVSAPVADGKRVLVAAGSQGEVAALDLRDGKELWRSSAGARLDSPPTLHRGLCLTACHDGWVYAFSAGDGALVWRTRIAPVEKRLVAFGQVESTWPAVGSPLVHNGVGYAVAGRATEMEGGCAVVAFDPGTGATRWATQLNGKPSRRVDVLQWSEDALLMQNWRIAPSDGTVLPLGPQAKRRAAGNLDGLLDGSWYYVGNRRSGKHMAGNLSGEVLVWDATTWYGFTLDRRMYGCFAISRDAAQEASPKDLKSVTYLWKGACKDLRVTALALAKNALVVAGSVDKTPAEGLLRLLNRETGDVLAEAPLTAPPVAHGIALTPEHLVVSLMGGSMICLGASGPGKTKEP